MGTEKTSISLLKEAESIQTNGRRVRIAMMTNPTYRAMEESLFSLVICMMVPSPYITSSNFFWTVNWMIVMVPMIKKRIMEAAEEYP